MRYSSDQKGFSLVELLVTLVIMGLVMTSVYGLFLNSQRTSVTSEEVVDVQQNLRIAYDMIARDLRMAGFAHAEALAEADDDLLALYSASPYGRYARVIDVEKAGTPVGSIPADDTDDYRVFIPQEQAKSMRPGHILHFCRPQAGTYVPDEVVAGTYFEVQAGPAEAAGAFYVDIARTETTGPEIDFAVAPNGDMLARVPPGGYYPYDNDPAGKFPYAIYYLLQDDTDPDADPNHKRLMRIVQRTDPDPANKEPLESQILATKILDDPADPDDGLLFSYILQDNTLVNAADANAAGLGNVVGVQIKLTGSTSVNRTGSDNFSGVKTREIIGRAHIKNRSSTSGT